MIHAAVVHTAIDPTEVLGRVRAPEDGAVLLFLGTVRNHADGQAVEGMTYEAYERMAAPVLGEIAREAAVRLGTDRVAVVHRVGQLAIGEISVAIAVSSPHRAESYDASRYVIEEIKKDPERTAVPKSRLCRGVMATLHRPSPRRQTARPTPCS
jgi:molybdopterin synthase catalytic subunit